MLMRLHRLGLERRWTRPWVVPTPPLQYDQLLRAIANEEIEP